MPDKNRLQAVLVPNEIIGALCARDYKGVGNQYVDEGKLVVQDAVVPLKTSNTKANGMNVGEPGDPMYTLDTGNSLAVAYSVREDAKNNNFSATETDVALCLNGLQPSTQSHHAQLFIAEPIPFRPTGFADYSEGVGTLRTAEMFATASHLVVDDTLRPYAYDEFNDSISETHHAIRAGTKQSTGVIQPIYYDALNDQANIVPGTLRANPYTSDFVAQPIIFENSFRDGPRIGDDVCHTLPAKMGSGGGNTPMLAEPVEQHLAVRRLTPLECERLMGWPDDHTRFYADGTEQADTHRYKQCGNGVATPVAKWIAKHLKNILITNDDE